MKVVYLIFADQSLVYERHAPYRDLLAAIPQTLVAAHSGPAAVTPAISTAVAPTGTVAGPIKPPCHWHYQPLPISSSEGVSSDPTITDSVRLSRLPYPRRRLASPRWTAIWLLSTS